MASPARTVKERDAVLELTARGHDVEAASAALASMDWQIEEADALLVARERLRQAVAGTQTHGACNLRPRTGPQPRLGAATHDGPEQSSSSPLKQKPQDKSK